MITWANLDPLMAIILDYNSLRICFSRAFVGGLCVQGGLSFSLLEWFTRFHSSTTLQHSISKLTRPDLHKMSCPFAMDTDEPYMALNNGKSMAPITSKEEKCAILPTGELHTSVGLQVTTAKASFHSLPSSEQLCCHITFHGPAMIFPLMNVVIFVWLGCACVEWK